MPDDCRLFTFPSNDYDALTMLYMQNQDLKGKSVQEIAEIYYNAYYDLKNHAHDIRNTAYDKNNHM